jgi:pimeloyl-ACP methyl ester carboxylesterase
VLLIHGDADPRTEPGELDGICTCLPHAQVAVLAGAGHSPHSERSTADVVTDLSRRFFAIGPAEVILPESGSPV